MLYKSVVIYVLSVYQRKVASVCCYPQLVSNRISLYIDIQMHEMTMIDVSRQRSWCSCYPSVIAWLWGFLDIVSDIDRLWALLSLTDPHRATLISKYYATFSKRYKSEQIWIASNYLNSFHLGSYHFFVETRQFMAWTEARSQFSKCFKELGFKVILRQIKFTLKRFRR